MEFLHSVFWSLSECILREGSMGTPLLHKAAGKHRNPCEDCLLFTGFLCFGSADLRSHEALTGLRVSADLQKQICLRKSAEP
jgi:hypothetical protein